MKFTNKQNLPDAIFRAVTNDPYDPGQSDFTATELIKPSRQRALEIKYDKEIEIDVAKRLRLLTGTLGHILLERAETLALTEQRYYRNAGKDKVGAKVDRLDLKNGHLTDYKFTSVWTAQNEAAQIDFIRQINIQAWILKSYGIEIKTTEALLILTDWKRRKAETERSYPKEEFVRIEIPKWSDEVTENFIAHRIKQHRAALKKLPECTAEERWATPTKYAVMKKKVDKAIKVYDPQNDGMSAEESQKFANAHVARLDKGKDLFGKSHYVQVRPGENIRCEHYCPVSKFCEQFKKLKGENEK